MEVKDIHFFHHHHHHHLSIFLYNQHFVPFVFCDRQMNLAPVRQAELHSDLKLQEKDELQWKKFKVEGLDENGEREAQLRRNFNGETTGLTAFPSNP